MEKHWEKLIGQIIDDLDSSSFSDEFDGRIISSLTHVL